MKKRSFFLSNTAKKIYSSQGKGEITGHCPICQSVLTQHEKLHSIVYENSKNTDSKCKIFGCPYCYHHSGSSVKRVCPVCKKDLPNDGFLISNLYEHKTNRHHIHVIGCSLCSKAIPSKV
ncbi:MAG: hypothetical protein ACRC4W_01025 [Treponemataceae bacterium]